MFGRSNFNIHGGTRKGSAGCIDLGNNEKEFLMNDEEILQKKAKLPGILASRNK